MKKSHKTQSVVNHQEWVVPFTVSRELVYTPSDTLPIEEDFRGGGLFISTPGFTKVKVTMSLMDTPSDFITRYLEPGYHPLNVYQIKATDTDTSGVTYIIQL